MRKLLANLPSPAMAVAFIALLAALSGTATALQGKNTVDSGDIKNGVVKSEDIKNGGVGSKDIKNGAVTSKKIKNGAVTSAKVKDGSLTGTDINESTLGKVPSAANADTATNATNATNANRAASAASVDGVKVSNQVRANNGQTLTIAESAGFRLELACDVAGSGATLNIVNVSGGDGAHFDDNLNGPQDDDFDQGETIEIYANSSADDIQNGAWTLLGSGGAALHGQYGVAFQPSDPGFGGAPCVVGATLFG